MCIEEKSSDPNQIQSLYQIDSFFVVYSVCLSNIYISFIEKTCFLYFRGSYDSIDFIETIQYILHI